MLKRSEYAKAKSVTSDNERQSDAQTETNQKPHRHTTKHGERHTEAVTNTNKPEQSMGVRKAIWKHVQ